MTIIKIISEWKKNAKNLAPNMKRVMAIIKVDGVLITAHIDVYR